MATIDAVINERLQQAVEILSQQFSVQAAYLFGSWAKGTADAWSDVDLAVFVKDIETLDLRTRARASAYVQKQTGDDIEVHFFPAEALQQADSASFTAYILEHGLPISLS